MHWFRVQAQKVKTQFVPLPLLQTLLEEMESRGVEEQNVLSTETGWVESEYTENFEIENRSILSVPFDGIVLRIPADDFGSILHSLEELDLREYKGIYYYKFHSKIHTLCLLPTQKIALYFLLQFKLKEANEVARSDFASYRSKYEINKNQQGGDASN